MLTVADALAILLAEVQPLPPAQVPLAEALGLVLAEEVVADRDSPPFDKALMDGYAVRSADLPDGNGQLRVIEEVLAGQVPQRTVGSGEATRIMTGAPMPAGADAVVPVEQTETPPDPASPVVEVRNSPCQPGRNILPRGASTRAGTVVLQSGKLLRPQELGCLAELGRGRVSVYPRVRAAVLATGDELVPVECIPGPGQIRNSNETMLLAQLQKLDAVPVSLGIARDNVASLRERIAVGLQGDLLLLSGGVSAGKVDLVPSVLAELGVREVFHKVRMKPGQPVWFGVYDAPQEGRSSRESAGEALAKATTACPVPRASRCYVFGLPGNPVSSMVCCELFARTALRRLMGIRPAEAVPVRARLQREHLNRGNRPTYHPAQLEWESDGAVVVPVPWVGSADLSATVSANAMVLFPEGDRSYSAGAILDVFPW